MDYKDISDDELMMLICEGNNDAKDILYTKYRYLTNVLVKKYYKMAMNVGMDLKDLNQEALVGFSDALNCYKDNQNASLKTFISLCIERRIQKMLLKYSRKKNQILNGALSLEYIYGCFDSSLADIISDNNENNPLTQMTRKEHYNDLVNSIIERLSAREKDVLNLMLNGFNYVQIATILNKTPKSIDNTIQRIKNKVKDVCLINE